MSATRSQRLFQQFASDQSGATSIEYAMIAVGITVVIIGTIQGLGSTVKGSYVQVQNALK